MEDQKNMKFGQTGKVIKFPGEPSGELETAAAAWLVRMNSGSVSLGELAEFEFWRADSAEHDRIYAEMEAIWEPAGAIAARSEPVRRSIPAARRPAGFSHWSARLGQIAAVIALVAVGSQYFSTWRYDYHTASGETRHVTLPDGSTIDMKGSTALNARVSATGARTVELARGEAFFEIVHDAKRPFTVVVGGGAIRDIGTAFSVAREGKSVTVAVAQGEVSVAGAGRSQSVVAGEQLSYSLYAMGRRQPVDIGVISAWRRGLYVAEGKPLGEVLTELGPYHLGPIIVTSHALAVRRVNAVVQLADIDRWLDSLDEAPGVSVHRWGPFTLVTDRAS